MMGISKRIDGERIFLEILNEECFSPEYIRWMQDEEVFQFLTSRNTGYTPQELKEYVANINGSSTDFLFGVFLKKGNKHIGNIKVGGIDPLHGFGDIGLIIGEKDEWSNGYGTEAIALATEYALDELDLNKLIAGMIMKNVGSYKAFIKAGYREVGTLTRHVVYKGEHVDTVLVEKCKEVR